MCRIDAMCYFSENFPPPEGAHPFSTAIPPSLTRWCPCFTRGTCNPIEPEEGKHLHIETPALKVNLNRNEIPFPLQLGARQLPRRLLPTRERFEEHHTNSR